MRIPLLGISHETNTFSSVPADYDAFVETGILRGSEIIDKFVDAKYTHLGLQPSGGGTRFRVGAADVRSHGGRSAPSQRTPTIVSPRRCSACFGTSGPWDAVLISNHGAAVSEEFPDMDGEFCRAVREIVGPDLRIGVTLDMHGNVSKPIVEHTDVCVVWRTPIRTSTPR